MAIRAVLALSCALLHAQAACAGAAAQPLLAVDLARVNAALADEATQRLRRHLADAFVEVSLASADEIALEQYAEAFKPSPSDHGRQAARQRLFLLSDAMQPALTGRSVLLAYEAVVAAADCAVDGSGGDLGCGLLLQARERLAAPKSTTDLSWPDGADWRRVAARPAGWALPQAAWTPLTLDSGATRLQSEVLFVKFDRPWLLEDFLGQGGWYLRGQCHGAVSDGDPSNDDSGLELLPRIPIGLLLTRHLTITGAQARVFTLGAAHVAGRVYRTVPRSPRDGDPCRRDCHRPTGPAPDDPACGPVAGAQPPTSFTTRPSAFSASTTRLR